MIHIDHTAAGYHVSGYVSRWRARRKMHLAGAAWRLNNSSFGWALSDVGWFVWPCYVMRH